MLEGTLPISPHCVPFGLRDGQMHGVEDVPTGKACGCICPECNSPLIAKNAGLKQQHHFSHQAGYGSDACRETAIHLIAKQILVRARQLLLPEWKRRCELRDVSGTPHFLNHERPAKPWGYAEATEEVWQDGIRPDVFLSDRGAAATLPLLVEVKVSHAVDDAKAHLVRHRGWAMVEIDLSKTPDDALAPCAFERYVLEGAPRKWIHAPKAEQRFAEARLVLRAKVDAINAELRRQGVEERDAFGRTAKERQKQQDIDRLRDSRRREYMRDLDALERKVLPEALRQREEELQAKEAEQIAALLRNFGGQVPPFARTAHRHAWALNTSSMRWHLAAADHFVLSAKEGARVTAGAVSRWLEHSFGVDEVAARLIEAQKIDRDRKRKRGDANVARTAWFFDDWENGAIPSVFHAADHLLDRLAIAGHLLRAEKWTYLVDGPVGRHARLEESKRRQAAEAEARRKGREEDERRLAKAIAEAEDQQRLAAIEREATDELRRKRVEQLTAVYHALAERSGECLDCQNCRWPSPPGVAACPNCGSPSLLLIKLDASRLREVPHRLRSDYCIVRCRSYPFE
ncbi:hypothetical protein [Cognatilysobacter segetis]|uniref:hypothetical protein n=1 Tax=Cognatilysobacter segetis TaxID=2492394 RepID=UPI00105E39FC|nr:hypothetical protein [Lysobacter segetis]